MYDFRRTAFNASSYGMTTVAGIETTLRGYNPSALVENREIMPWVEKVRQMTSALSRPASLYDDEGELISESSALYDDDEEIAF